MDQIIQRFQKHAKKFTTFSVWLGSLALSSIIYANPVLQNIEHGDISVQQTSTTTTINQTTQNGIVNWQSFNIQADEHTHFEQPENAWTLNKISGSQGVSEIYGKLTATSNIILVNPAGIFFGPRSFINVGGMIATTAGISKSDFLSGNFRFNQIAAEAGSITNQGRIVAMQNGLIALVANGVSNSGHIEANLGNVVIGSANTFTMTFDGADYLAFQIDKGAAKGITNTGTISANGGKVEISAKAAQDVLSQVVNLDGVIEANSVGMSGGTLRFMSDSERGYLIMKAKARAKANDLNQKGGSVTITGRYIVLADGAVIDVSGPAGGGDVRIGGDYQGKGDLSHAMEVTMMPTAAIYADATNYGNGGKVILWSDDYTKASGIISARGGPEGGNGGLVETSSKNILDVGNMYVNTSAAKGKSGLWLLDPTYSVINAEAATSIVNSLANTNVTNTSSSSITVDSAITWTSSNTLSLVAVTDIIINAAISGVNGRLELTAQDAAASITTGPSGTISVGEFALLAGRWYQNTALLPAFAATNSFEIDSGGATEFLRAKGGDGTSGTPYQIADVYGLQGITYNRTAGLNLLSKEFDLANNIDASVTRNWNSGEGFIPIGNNTNRYTGTFDGNSKIISDLYINRNSQYQGLFGYTNNATISDLTLLNTTISGQNSGNIGSFIGRASGTTLSNIQAIDSNISGSIAVGGIVGYLQGSSITEAFSSGNISGSSQVGGIVGDQSFGSDVISYSYNIASVSGTSDVGGIIGSLQHGHLTNNYSTGLVTGTTNVGGVIGRARGNNDTDSTGNLWDTVTSGQAQGFGVQETGSDSTIGVTGGCFGDSTGCATQPGANSSNEGAAVDLTLLTTYTDAGWSTTAGTAGSISNSASTSSTAPNYTWFIFEGETRPMLMMEHNTSISNAHQLQLMGTTLGASYTLGNDIDLQASMTNASDIWGTNKNAGIGSGWVPVGERSNSFRGSLEGSNYAISNLYINRTAGDTYHIGLFSNTSGATSSISNINVINADINVADVTSTEAAGIGILIGINGWFSPNYAGGGTLSNVFTSGTIDISDINQTTYVGGLAGVSGGPVSNSGSETNINITTSNALTAGGLLGMNYDYSLNPYTNGSLHRSYSSGSLSITATPTATNGVLAGGLVGNNSGAILDNSYSTTNVSVFATNASGEYNVGGLAGQNHIRTGGTTADITNVYASGSISNKGIGTLNTGGLIGRANNENGEIPDITNAYWDVITTGQTAGIGSIDTSTNGDAIAGCFAGGGTCATVATITNAYNAGSDVVPVDLSDYATYSGSWGTTIGAANGGIIATPSATSTAPDYTWFMFDGLTRPMLMSEYSSKVYTAHQVQLMGTTLDADYILADHVDLSGGMNNASDVWGTNKNTNTGSGFVAIGASSFGTSTEDTNFIGSLDGQGYVIDNLYIDQASLTNTSGLFGTLADDATIQNLSLTNVDITAANMTGGLAGRTLGTGTRNINNVYVSGNITAERIGSDSHGVGGLIGIAGGSANTISNVYSTVNIIATNLTTAGGLIGRAEPVTLSNSYSMGEVASDGGTAGGLIGAVSGTNSVSNSYWDTDTSGVSTSAAGTGYTTSQFLDSSNFSNWDISTTASSNRYKPDNVWFMFEGDTRPMLLMEHNNSIASAHQLQLMGVALDANYTLANNIDLSGTSSGTDAWGSEGFVPIGVNDAGYTAIFSGNDYTISKLYMNRAASEYQSLIAELGANASVGNLTLSGSVTGLSRSALLASENAGTIYNTHVSGTVVGSGTTGNEQSIGGLVAENDGLISNSSSDVDVSIETVGTGSTGFSIGSLAGRNHTSGSITKSFSTGDVYVGTTASDDYGLGNGLGGLAGANYGTISQSYSTGSVELGAGNTPQLGMGTAIGGFVGGNFGTITDSYVTGNVTIGTSTGSNAIGGFAGANYADISRTYSSGLVSGTATNVGGFIGFNSGASATPSASFWDTASSGQTTDVGFNNGGTITNVDGSTFATTLATTSTYTDAPYSWSVGSDPTATTWVQIDGSTRPMLAWEYSTNIRSAHSLQLMALDLTKHYKLVGNIDASKTGQASGVWGADGFIPIGNLAANFSGKLDGQNYKISNLVINRSTTDNVGLFGDTTSQSAITDLVLENFIITGNAKVGALVGKNDGTISNVRLQGTSTITGYDDSVGGLIGSNIRNNPAAGVSDIHVSGNVTVTGSDGTNDQNYGGLIGTNDGDLDNASVNLTSANGVKVIYGNGVGGLIGQNVSGTISNVSSTATVEGLKNVGGLIGILTGNIDGANNSIIVGEETIVRGSTISGQENAAIGGLVGYAGPIDGGVDTEASIQNISVALLNPITAYNIGSSASLADGIGGLVGHFERGSIKFVYSGTDVIANQNAGGLVGSLDTHYASGSPGNAPISDSYSTGDVTVDGSNAGGLIGYGHHVQVTRSYSTGKVTGGSSLGGLVGEALSGGSVTATNNFWDTNTSGQTAACGTGTCSSGMTGKTTAEMMTASTFSGTWGTTTGATSGGISSTVETGSTMPDYTWFIFNGQTRPMLMMEYSTNIKTAHGLQLAGSTLGADYTLANDIDLSKTNNSDVWGAQGFAPIGDTTNNFTGTFNGNHHIIDNLYIDNTGTSVRDAALFGVTSGDDMTIQNLGVTNANITVGTVVSPDSNGAILIGNNTSGSNTISNVYTTGLVTGLVSFARYGGLIGRNVAGNISDSYSTATINATATADNWINVGGLVAVSNGGSISRSYSSGDIYVTLNQAPSIFSLVGGLVGQNNNASITDSYSLNNITVTTPAAGGLLYVGGLVAKHMGSATIDNSYSSGAISIDNAPTYLGGLVGRIEGTANITSSLWDASTSGILNGWGAEDSSNTMSNVFGGCFGNTSCGTITNASSATPKDLSLLASYNSGGPTWNITATPSSHSVKPGYTWFIFDGETRPILLSEYSTNIKNAHQLQLMGAVLGADYTLANDIDLNSGVTNAADVWGTNKTAKTGSGFNPIGNNSTATAFRGTFDGQNYIIDNLYINRPTENYVGLFGVTLGNISNVGVTNVDISGQASVGGIAGFVSNGGSTRFTNGSGANLGDVNVAINNTFSSGSITSSGDSTDYNSSYAGGLVGFLTAGSITNSFSSAAVNGVHFVGGLVGEAFGSISTSYASGDVTSTGQYVGGLVGAVDLAGSISNTYSLGKVTGSQYVGGLVGATARDISNSYSSGRVSGDSNTGGLLGQLASGTVSNSFWDTDTSNQASSAGGTGKTTSQMLDDATFAAWDISSTPSSTQIAPTETWFIFDTDTRPMLMMEHSTTIRNAHQLQLAGSTLGASYTLANDIDLGPHMSNASEVWGTNKHINSGKGFKPIGDSTNRFTGTLNGQGYVVSNLYIDRPTTDFVGLIGSSSNATISNIGVEATVTGRFRVAGLVGDTYQTTIENSFSNSTVVGTGVYDIGGLVGFQQGSTVSDSYSAGSVSATGSQTAFQAAAGGLVGSSNNSLIKRSYNLANVYALGTVSGSNPRGVGGLVGVVYNGASSVKDSYNLGNVYAKINDGGSGDGAVGGLVGYIQGSTTANPTITRSYSTGYVSNTGTGVSGGFIGRIDSGNTISNNFWDVATSGQTKGFGANSGTVTNLNGGCFAGSGTCATTTISNATNAGTVTPSNLASQTTYSGASWDIGTDPNFDTWVQIDGGTRPMLAWEYSDSSISNAHQLQLIGLNDTTLAVNYTLENDIDMSATQSGNTDVWGSEGFSPIGTLPNPFKATFDGNNHVIDNLYINNTTQEFVGLFGFVQDGSANIQNVGLTNAYVKGSRTVGGLAGELLQTTGNGAPTVSNAYVTGTVISDGALTGEIKLGGLVGANNGGNIEYSYNAADVIGTHASSSNRDIGGLVGAFWSNGATVSIKDSYNIGSISSDGSTNGIGGLVGRAGFYLGTQTISNSYNTGYIDATSNAGGILGQKNSNVTLSNNVWDTSTSNISDVTQGCGNSASCSGATGLTRSEMTDSANYSTWDITTTPSATTSAPDYTWFMFEGATRPILMSEHSTNIRNAHQLQLMGAVLDADYTLANDIDLNSSMTNAADVWATNRNHYEGNGWVSVGQYSGGSNDKYFTGTFDGQGHVIDNLYIRNSDRDRVGLFGFVEGSNASISNVGLTNFYINQDAGTDFVGGLAGQLHNGASVSDSFAVGDITISGSVTHVGGLIGRLNDSIAERVYANVNIVSNNTNTMLGGLIGDMRSSFDEPSTPSILRDSYSLGSITVNGGDVSSDDRGVGGAIGMVGFYGNSNTVDRVYSASKVTASGDNVGGLVGNLNSDTGSGTGTISDSYWDKDSSSISDATKGCGDSVSCSGVTGLTTTQALSGSNYASSWDIGTDTVTNAWLQIDSQTRPILAMEIYNSNTNALKTNIHTGHQLQFIELNSTTLDKDYTLGANIDLAGSANSTGIWGTSGFKPIGDTSTTFSGNFDGNNKTISNIYISRTDDNGLFGRVYSSDATFQDLTLSGGSVISSGTDTGSLIGEIINGSTVTIDNVHSSVSVDGNLFIGGLVGTSTIGGSGSVTISNSSYSGTNDGNDNAGGLVGRAGDLTINKSFNAGTLNSITGVGGLLGYAFDNVTINQSYNSGEINSTGTNAGGLVGGYLQSATQTITDSYNVGNIDGNSVVGGIVGQGSNVSLTNVYNSGAVTGNTTVGAIAGSTGASSVFNEIFWDNGINSSIGIIGSDGGTTKPNVGTGSFDGTNAGSLAASATYSDAPYSWDIGADPSTNTWVIINGETRPMLAWEYGTTVRTGHGLQLIGLSGTTRAADYTLANDIDLSGTASGSSDVWSPTAGWDPIDSFAGSIDGNGYTVRDMNINRSTTTNGLFGTTTSAASISNISVTGTIDGSDNTIGGLVGNNAGKIDRAYSGVDINRTSTATIQYVGGLVGRNSGTITKSYSDSTITLDSTTRNQYVGGFSGETSGSISESFFSGSVNLTGPIIYVSGFTGQLSGSLTNVYVSGDAIRGANSNNETGLLVGRSLGGVVTNALTYGYTNLARALVGGCCSGTVTSSFADSNTTGISSLGNFGGSFATTSALQQEGTYSGWDFNNVWGIDEGNSYPYLRAFYPDAPRMISGNISGGSTGKTVAVNAGGGAAVATDTTGEAGSYQFLLGNNVVSGIDTSIASNKPMVVYVDDGNVTNGNRLVLAPADSGSVSGLIIHPNEVRYEASSTGTITNADFFSAKGTNTDSDILFSGTTDLALSSSSYSLAFDVDDGATLTYADNFVTNGNLIKYDTGTLNLSNANLAPGNININAGTLDITIPSGTTTFANTLLGNGTLTKTGDGELRLSGVANTFTGITNVNAGTLRLQSTNALGSTNTSNINVAKDATFRYASSANSTLAHTGQINLSGVLILSGSVGETENQLANNINIQDASHNIISYIVGTLSGDISGSVGLNKSGSEILVLSGNNTYTGTTNINAGTLRLGSNNTIPDTSQVNINGASRTLDMNDFSDTVDSITGAGNILLGSTPGNTLTVSNSSGDDYTLSNPISGLGNFEKAGNNTVTLGWTNTSTGNTLVSGGTLIVDSDARFGLAGSQANGRIAISGGGTLDIPSAFTINLNRGIAFNGAGGTIDLNAGTMTYAGSLSGSGAFTKTGAGSITLTNGGTLSGAINLNEGNLTLQHANALGNANSSQITIASGTQLAVDFNGTFGNTGQINFGGTLRNTNGAGDPTLTNNILLTNNSTIIQAWDVLTLSGVIDDGDNNYNLTKSAGYGQLRLANPNNTYGGKSYFAGGATVYIANDGSLGDTPSTLITDAITLGANENLFTLNTSTDVNLHANRGITILAGGTNIINTNNSSILTINGPITGSSNYLSFSGGTNSFIDLINPNNDFTAPIRLAGNVHLRIAEDAVLGNKNNNISFSNTGTLQTTTSFELDSSRDLLRTSPYSIYLAPDSGTELTYNGNISNEFTFPTTGFGTGLTINGNGTTILGGTSDLDGDVRILNGTVKINSPTALSNYNPNSDNTIYVYSSGNLQFTFNNDTLVSELPISVSNAGSKLSFNGTDTVLNNPISVASNTFDGTGTATLNGIISGTNLTKDGTGTITFNGVNTHVGTILNDGIYQIATDRALGADPGASYDADRVIFNGGTLQNTADVTIASNRGFTFNAGNGVIDTNANTTLTHNGILTGTGGFTKTGAGTLVLGGNSSYNGTTALNVGKIIANHASALGSTVGGTSIANGAQLDVNNVTIASEAITSILGTGINGEGALVGLGTAGFNGNITLSGSTTVGGNGNFGLGGAIGGAHTLTYLFDGNVTPTGNSTYSGGTLIDKGRAIMTNANTVFGSNNTVTADQDGTLQINDGLTNAYNLRLAGTGYQNAGALLANGDVSHNGTTVFTADGVINIPTAGKLLTVNGTIDGPGGMRIKGNGNIKLAGAVGSSNTLGSLITDVPLTINANITTRGNQIYNAEMTNAGDYTLRLTGEASIKLNNILNPGDVVLNMLGVLPASNITLHNGTNNVTITSAEAGAGTINTTVRFNGFRNLTSTSLNNNFTFTEPTIINRGTGRALINGYEFFFRNTDSNAYRSQNGNTVELRTTRGAESQLPYSIQGNELNFILTRPAGSTPDIVIYGFDPYDPNNDYLKLKFNGLNISMR